MSEPSVPPPPPPPYTPPPPPAGPASGAVSPNRNIMIVLSYLWLLAIIPFVTEKEDKEVQWHAKHGIVLMIAEAIIWVAFFAVDMMLVLMHLGFVGCFLFIVRLAIFLGILVVHVICIIKGTQGQRFLIPGISQYADRF